MRLWHYELISILPKNILIRLWHDCEAIGSNLERKGTTGDVKCEKILDYASWEFYKYCLRVKEVMLEKHCKINSRLSKLLFDRIKNNEDKFHTFNLEPHSIFMSWHDLNYFDLCYKLIKELHDCNVIKNDDWFEFDNYYRRKRITYVDSMLYCPATDIIARDRDRYDAIIDGVSAIRRFQIDAIDPYISSLSITTDSIPSGITLSASAPDTIISTSSPTEIPF